MTGDINVIIASMAYPTEKCHKDSNNSWRLGIADYNHCFATLRLL